MKPLQNAGTTQPLLNITPTDATLGAILTGVDIAAGLDERTVMAIRDAVLRYSVLVIRDQVLTPADHVAFTSRIGEVYGKQQPNSLDQNGNYMPPSNDSFTVPGYPEISIVSNIKENGRKIGITEAGMFWHSDNSFRKNPDQFLTFYAMEVPIENGVARGDTLFVSAPNAYDGLDEATRRKIDGLRVVQSYNYHLERLQKLYPEARKRPTVEKESRALAEFTHPLVLTHPITGRKILYASEMFSARIEGMPEQESRQLLDELCAHIARDQFMYRHNWRKGDFLVFDNLATQHHATFDYGTIPRRLNRCGTYSYLG